MSADITIPASLIGDPTRAAFLLALADKDGLPLSDLARRADVSNSTASIQLGKLVDSALLAVERHGRHCYFRLSSPAVARALRALAVIAPAAPVRTRPANGSAPPAPATTT